MAGQGWRTTQVLAWTEREGPGRPPKGASGGLWMATAATLGVVFSTFMFTDALCPEHRSWVQALGTLALVGVVVSIVGMLRGWASAPLVTAGTAGLGVAIGLIDAVHSPVRGSFIAGAFVLTLVLSGWVALRQVPLLRWDRRVLRDAAPAEQAWASTTADDDAGAGSADAPVDHEVPARQ